MAALSRRKEGLRATRGPNNLSRIRSNRLSPNVLANGPRPSLQQHAWSSTSAAPACAAPLLAAQPASLPSADHRHRCRHRGSAPCSAASAAAGGASSSGDNSSSGLLAALTAFAQAQFLPLALVTAILLGCICPAAGVAVGKLPNLNTFVTTAMFVISGLQLRQGEALQALKAKGSVAFGVVSILFLTPLLAARPVLSLPLAPPELALGLAVFCCMPTALSSGITLTQQVGGNVALALLLTVASNMLGVFTMPWMLPALLGPGLGGVALEPLPLLLRLLQSVLLPCMAGAAVRAFVPGAAEFIDARRKQLAYAAAILLALVPWTQVSATVARGTLLDPAALALVAAAGVGVHLAFLALNMTACELFRLGSSDPVAARGVRRAVILTASVKTLPVAVAVLAGLGPALGPGGAGLAVVPAMAAHLSQILIDSSLVARWRAADAAAAGGGKK